MKLKDPELQSQLEKLRKEYDALPEWIKKDDFPVPGKSQTAILDTELERLLEVEKSYHHVLEQYVKLLRKYNALQA